MCDRIVSAIRYDRCWFFRDTSTSFYVNSYSLRDKIRHMLMPPSQSRAAAQDPVPKVAAAGYATLIQVTAPSFRSKSWLWPVFLKVVRDNVARTSCGKQHGLLAMVVRDFLRSSMASPIFNYRDLTLCIRSEVSLRLHQHANREHEYWNSSTLLCAESRKRWHRCGPESTSKALLSNGAFAAILTMQ